MLVEADLVRTDRHTDKTTTVTLASACAPRVNDAAIDRHGRHNHTICSAQRQCLALYIKQKGDGFGRFWTDMQCN